MVIGQISQWVNFEVHCRTIWGPQSPDPHTILYFPKTWITDIQVVHHLGGHVRLSMPIASEVFCHQRFFSPPVCNVKMVVIDPAIYTCTCSSCPVLPTFCGPHLPQVNKEIILKDLQEATNFTLNRFVTSCKSSTIIYSLIFQRCGQPYVGETGKPHIVGSITVVLTLHTGGLKNLLWQNTSLAINTLKRAWLFER